MTENFVERSIANKQVVQNSKMKKFWIILVTLLILLIPIAFLKNIISDRQDYKQEAINTVASSWGNSQTIYAPEMDVISKKGEKYVKQNLALNDYNVEVNIQTEVRKKGLFKIPVYTADVVLKGDFKNKYGNIADKMLATSFSVSDSTGFLDKPVFKINNNPAKEWQETGYITNIKTSESLIPFEISYKIRGLNDLDIITSGANNNIKISGNWKNPSFTGNFLPAKREIGKNFSAEWSVPKIAASGIERPSVGVSLLMPVDNYRMADRTLKYAFLFLALTFMSYFVFELTSGTAKRIHPLQYMMLGAAMLMFYLLLVSMSEFLPFGLAYIVAALMVIALASAYTYFVITRCNNKEFSYVIAGLLTLLYVFLYVLLLLQDFALLLGSLGLFIIIAVIMYVTRNVDWYNDEQS